MVIFKFKKIEAHQWQKFIWLVFVENLLETNALLIPLDCEFILIEFVNKSIYKMAEIYTVKNKSFSLEFGTWDINGLSSSKRGFYRRRENFQGVKLTMWYSGEVSQKAQNLKQNKAIFLNSMFIATFKTSVWT